MTQNMYIPFTYHICWSKENLHYYGVRVAKGCHPNDLWTKYFTSSKKVKELRESLGEPDIKEVRKKFINREQAIDWEVRVLKKLKVVKKNMWINQSCWPHCDTTGRVASKETVEKMSGENNHFYGKQHTNKTKELLRKKATGYKHTPETIAKMSGENNIRYGKKHTPETIKKMSESRMGKGNPMYGRKLSDETKKKMSEANKRYHQERKRKQNG